MRSLKFLGLTTLVSLSAIMSNPCAAAAGPYDGKTLNIAVNAIYPPLEYHDPASNALMGFDIDLGNALAHELGAKIVWQESAFAQLMPSLASQRADLVLSGLNDRVDRRTSADFVDYLNSGAQMFVAKADPVTDMTQLCGKRIAMSRSTSFPASTTGWSDIHCVQAGHPAMIIVGAEDSAAARMDLRQQRVDAVVQGSETIPYTMQLEPNAYRIVDKPFTVTQQGIAFRKTDTALRAAVASALTTLIQNGTYGQIVDRWHLQSSQAHTVTINGAALSQ